MYIYKAVHRPLLATLYW